MREILAAQVTDIRIRPKSERPTAKGDVSSLAGPLLDPRALDNVRSLQHAGAPDLLRRIIEIYLETSPHLLQILRDAIALDPIATGSLRNAAHSLKASSANLGATTLVALCKDLEEMGRQNRVDEAAVTLKAIENAYSIVRDALAAELQAEAA